MRQASFGFGSRVEREFLKWIETDDGLRVEMEIVTRAHRIQDRGLSHYGIAALFESIRYDSSVGLLGDGEFRLNNNHRSLMARRIMDRYPSLAGFFEVRRLRALNGEKVVCGLHGWGLPCRECGLPAIEGE